MHFIHQLLTAQKATVNNSLISKKQIFLMIIGVILTTANFLFAQSVSSGFRSIERQPLRELIHSQLWQRSNVYLQPIPTTEKARFNRKVVFNFNPDRPKLNRYQILIGASILTASSFAFDIYIRSAAEKQTYHSLDWWFDRTNRIGENDIVAYTVGSTLAIGLLTKSPKMQQATLNSIRSLLIAKPTTNITKRLVGRARPQVERGNMHYAPSLAQNDPDFRAFSSGHTATAWALITPYAEAYSRWLYILPFSTGLARIYLDRHWVSDVVAGTFIGFFSGYTAHHGDQFNFRLTGNGFKLVF